MHQMFEVASRAKTGRWHQPTHLQTLIPEISWYFCICLHVLPDFHQAEAEVANWQWQDSQQSVAVAEYCRIISMSFLRCCFWPILRSGFINTALQVWPRTWPWKIGWHEWNQQPTNADSEGYIQKQGISRASWSYIIQIYSNAMFPTNIKEQININQCKKIATKQNPKRALKKTQFQVCFILTRLWQLCSPCWHPQCTRRTLHWRLAALHRGSGGSGFFFGWYQWDSVGTQGGVIKCGWKIHENPPYFEGLNEKIILPSGHIWWHRRVYWWHLMTRWADERM